MERWGLGGEEKNPATAGERFSEWPRVQGSGGTQTACHFRRDPAQATERRGAGTSRVFRRGAEVCVLEPCWVAAEKKVPDKGLRTQGL